MFSKQLNFLDISFEEYKKIDAISRSDLLAFESSIKYYKYTKENSSEETAAMKFGRMVHKFILEHNKFEEEYFITNKIRKIGDKWDALQKEAGNREIIFQEDYDQLLSLSNSLLENNIIRIKGLINNPISEKTAIWKDIKGETNLDCKCRFDIVRMTKMNSIIDLKTTCNANPKEFMNEVFKYKYHLQAAFYIDGFEAITQQKCHMFLFIVVEKQAPYLNNVFYIERDDPIIEQGRCEYINLLNEYKISKEKNFEEENKFHKIEMPNWYKFKINN